MTDDRSFFRQIADHVESSLWPMAALLAVSIARLWLAPLPSSFWVDELVTLFVVRHPGHASFAVAPQVPQSIYYWLPRAAYAVAGPSEVFFRIPSMAAMGIALWLIGRLAVRLIHPRAAWFVVFAALSIRGVDYFAIDARPYALGMMVASACMYFLVRWLDFSRWSDAAVFVFFAALVWRVHLLYWPFYPVIAIYAVARLVRGETSVTWPAMTGVSVATAISLLPQAISALSLYRGAQSHVFVSPPTLHIFEHELHWNIPLLCGAAAWLVAKFARARPAVQPTAWVVILSWWLVQPVCLYLYSHLTANSVYVGRYLSIMLPGAALTTAAVVSLWIPAERWRSAAAVMALAALIFQGHWESLWFRHDVSDWRAAAQEVNRFAPDVSIPVIAPSPFIEARPPSWTPDYALPGFLYAHLDGYPIMGKAYLFPFDSPPDTPEGVRYADSLLDGGQLISTGKWAIYGPERHVRDWRKWFAGRSEFAAWRNTLLEFGDVYVAEFSEISAK
jgi:hypothetical protein